MYHKIASVSGKQLTWPVLDTGSTRWDKSEAEGNEENTKTNGPPLP